MTNTLIPVEERTLTPDQVEQPRSPPPPRSASSSPSPGSASSSPCLVLHLGRAGCHLLPRLGLTPMLFWDALTFGLALIFGLVGYRLRRGATEFFSY